VTHPLPPCAWPGGRTDQTDTDRSGLVWSPLLHAEQTLDGPPARSAAQRPVETSAGIVPVAVFCGDTPCCPLPALVSDARACTPSSRSSSDRLSVRRWLLISSGSARSGNPEIRCRRIACQQPGVVMPPEHSGPLAGPHNFAIVRDMLRQRDGRGVIHRDRFSEHASWLRVTVPDWAIEMSRSPG
jgi:hypothetical protein